MKVRTKTVILNKICASVSAHGVYALVQPDCVNNSSMSCMVLSVSCCRHILLMEVVVEVAAAAVAAGHSQHSVSGSHFERGSLWIHSTADCTLLCCKLVVGHTVMLPPVIAGTAFG